VVVLAVVAAIALLIIPRNDRVVPSIVTTGPEPVPAFAFAVTRTGALPTAAIKVRKPVRTDPTLRLRGPSKRASSHAIATITRFYRGAFLDPANWRAGTYDDLWQDFAKGAQARARTDVSILTAGPAAGPAYLAIVPRRSTVRITVLLDGRGRPVVVLADARFRALGRRIAGGSNTVFDSTGRFFLERTGGGWGIVSYDVRRSDEKVAKPPPVSPSPNVMGAS
jgi:hypothetical protein